MPHDAGPSAPVCQNKERRLILSRAAACYPLLPRLLPNFLATCCDRERCGNAISLNFQDGAGGGSTNRDVGNRILRPLLQAILRSATNHAHSQLDRPPVRIAGTSGSHLVAIALPPLTDFIVRN